MHCCSSMQSVRAVTFALKCTFRATGLFGNPLKPRVCVLRGSENELRILNFRELSAADTICFCSDRRQSEMEELERHLPPHFKGETPTSEKWGWSWGAGRAPIWRVRQWGQVGALRQPPLFGGNHYHQGASLVSLSRFTDHHEPSLIVYSNAISIQHNL